MKLKPLSIFEAYKLIEPGPVVLVSTAHKGKENVMAMAWHAMMEFTPPLIGCVVSNRDFSFGLLKASKQCVIAVPTVELAPKVVKIGNVSGKNLDKFKKFGLTKLPAAIVKAPLVGDCYANLECKVTDVRLMNKYNFFILEVVKAWVNPNIKHPRFFHHVGLGHFIADGRKFKLPWKLGQ
jgi:flavin reductase (DIM6/NTAB) family NADH-FMN oxidoreductase RutF